MLKPSGTGTRRPAGWSAVWEQNPDPAGVVVGRDKFVGKAEFGGKLARPRLGRDPAVGTALDREAAFADGFDESAETIRGFKQHRFDGRSGASLARDSYAAVRPAMPPPMMAMRFMRLAQGSRFEVRGSS